MKFPAIRYIPKGAVKVADKKSDAVAYIYEAPRNGKTVPCAIIYFGKQNKPVGHYQFGSTPKVNGEQMRAKRIAELFAARQAVADYKAKCNAERKAYVNNYKVGEILVCSWGYDQTNIDWYEVVGVRGQMVDIRPIAKKYIETCHNMSGQCWPLPGAYKGEVMSKRASQDGLKISSYSSAHRAEFEMVAGIKVYRAHYESHYA